MEINEIKKKQKTIKRSKKLRAGISKKILNNKPLVRLREKKREDSNNWEMREETLQLIPLEYTGS